MLDNFKIAVIIPCYNVGAKAALVIEGLPDFVDEIVAVEDASTDNTLEILTRLAAENPRLVLLRHAVNKGLGAGMIDGYQRCLDDGADIIVKMDGDDQMDPAYLYDLVGPIMRGECDYAKANRFLHREELTVMPAVRLAGNIIMTFLTKVASGYWNNFDPQNGYVAISAAALGAIRLKKLDRRYFFENQMLIELNIREAVVMDVAIPARYRDEKSSLRIGKILTYFPTLLVRGTLSRLFNRYVLRNFSIIIIYLVLGLAMVTFGGLFGAIKWYTNIRDNTYASAGTIMLSVLPLIWGMQMLLQSILIDIMNAPPIGYARFRKKIEAPACSGRGVKNVSG